VNEINGGDDERAGFDSGIMIHLDHLYRVAFHLVKNSDEAQDCVQETCARALGARDQFSPGTNLKAWLTRILYNFYFDAYARNRRLILAEDLSPAGALAGDFWETTPTPNPGPEALVLEQEMEAQISEALKRLPEEFRAPIVLVDIGELSYLEAAEVLACPVGTVRSRLSRGRKLLHNQLRGYMRFPGADG
jgi:RNA polymerase sigma-70 factor, ECF subfamily